MVNVELKKQYALPNEEKEACKVVELLQLKLNVE
jgi:hypothetical protein